MKPISPVKSGLKLSLTLLSLLSLHPLAACLGQEFDGEEEVNPRERVMRNFSQKAPALGDPLPNVTVYDASGERFELSKLKGHYSVLVFGCLT